jgi:hypothetical protein
MNLGEEYELKVRDWPLPKGSEIICKLRKKKDEGEKCDQKKIRISCKYN